MKRVKSLQSLLKVAISIAGGVSVALGLVVLAGWYSHNVALIQIRPQFVPMQYNTAMGFVLSGLALLALAHRLPRPALVCATIVTALGLATLFEYIIDVDLGIDQLLMQHYITVLTTHPGRMAPNTALCFALSGSAVLLSAGTIQRWVAPINAIFGSLVLALGVIAFFGYVIGLETVYGWGRLTRMAIHTSAGFIVVGSGIILWAWHKEWGSPQGLPDWIPATVGIGSLAITLTFWQALHPGQAISVSNYRRAIKLTAGGG